ncbi:VacJ family lipoprotein [Rhizorhabdus dicambivorans]|uniref:VacJ family lipoprotein n=2 Tax=Rhizorhabdus dicambivorans TaxID=1850238 RepID=A0A2A4FS24_9SPHN|nr:VacJ family lipoprotein [Rhizorhabdus dicambivorans]PCE40520.1 VacJ family lipoprotein [Rhizorhabdus dicambivorans]
MIGVVTLGLALSACTTTRVGTDRLAEKDPLEGFNRGVWAVNRGADKVIVKPVSQVYRAVTPKPARDGVRNFFANVGEPFSFINNILQGKGDRAIRNLGRFVVNTTIGIGGLFDQASRMKIQPAPEDLGQTFAAWGMNGGPYLVLPLLGPSTMRDGVGTGLSQVADPYRYCLNNCDLPNGLPIALTATEVISTRAGLIEAGADNFLESSLDPYAAARSAYLQRRRAEILNRDAADLIPDEGDEANPALDDALSAADADAGIPGTDTAPSPGAENPPAPPVEAPNTPETVAPDAPNGRN